MTDEKFVYVTDVAEKKRTARGSHNKRTHCGKGGTVRFSSDYMSRKEIEAMNGDVKVYRLNDPMKWDEFNELPDDLKMMYVQSLRRKFNVSDVKIFEMLGVNQSKGSVHFRKLGLSLGRGSFHGSFLKEEWLKWLNGIKVPAPVAENRGCEAEVEKTEEKKGGVVLDLQSKGMLHRAIGRIEGVACGCDEAVKKCLLLSVLQISIATGLRIEEAGEENAAD